jgi:hypothetical protein
MASEPIAQYQQPQYYGGSGQVNMMGPMQQVQQTMQQPMPSHMQQAQPQMQSQDVAGMLNDQLPMQVPPDAYVDPNQQRAMMLSQQGSMQSGDNKGKIPEFLKDPLVVFVLVLFLGLPAVRDWLSKYVPQLAGDDGKVTTMSSVVTALLVAALYAVLKKFVLKN